MNRTRRWCAAVLLAACLTLTACQTMKTTGKVLVTPVLVVRDVVDVPLVAVTNASLHTARASVESPFTIAFGFFILDPLSYLFGAADYLVCRSFYPASPDGLSPWRHWEYQFWFPNTQALWNDEAFHERLEAQRTTSEEAEAAGDTSKLDPLPPDQHHDNPFYRIAGKVMFVINLITGIGSLTD